MPDFSALRDRATRENWALVALDLGVDTTTPSGEMMATGHGGDSRGSGWNGGSGSNWSREGVGDNEPAGDYSITITRKATGEAYTLAFTVDMTVLSGGDVRLTLRDVTILRGGEI